VPGWPGQEIRLRAYPGRPAQPIRLIRGAGNRPIHSPHYQCAFAARAAPGIHASTGSAAPPYRDRPLTEDAMPLCRAVRRGWGASLTTHHPRARSGMKTRRLGAIGECEARTQRRIRSRRLRMRPRRAHSRRRAWPGGGVLRLAPRSNKPSHGAGNGSERTRTGPCRFDAKSQALTEPDPAAECLASEGSPNRCARCRS
jgi:hypothetical protein